ncbi:MAG: NAD(P)H-hydrate dehydratase [Bacteroidaceae bacterium]|nr:NAD(P)H-hydrate dehydratase [Bacteroidaceae bacterium]
MKILTAVQMRELDAYTIEHEPISSIDLMERASKAFADKIISRWNISTVVKVFAGPGNNGGDALAVARMLSNVGYTIQVYLFNTKGHLSSDCETNKNRLQKCHGVIFEEIRSSFNPPILEETDLVIDGLFGSGINRPLSAGFASVVKYINSSNATVVSIDVPSGLMCEDNAYNVSSHVVKANYTYTFQYPKLSFFFPENETFVGHWEIVDIGLVDPKKEFTSSPYHFTEEYEVGKLLKNRSRFVHKGSVGHAALVAGKGGMAGAAILAARACLRSGVGKVTVRTPECNVIPLQISVPEAVLSIDPDPFCFSAPIEEGQFDAMAMGPGMGKEATTVHAFLCQLGLSKVPLVLDADAINILGDNRIWIERLPKRTILTPHKKELFGLISKTVNSYEQLEKTRTLCMKQELFIVIKGALSAVCCPDGKVYFNPTGNPGMATAGSGDVLTGVILSLLAQEYSPEQATLLGVYLHGLAGDIAAEKLGYEGVLAGDIVECLPAAFLRLRNSMKSNKKIV